MFYVAYQDKHIKKTFEPPQDLSPFPYISTGRNINVYDYMVLDVDTKVNINFLKKSLSKDNLPFPNFVIQNPDNGHAHLVWKLACPVYHNYSARSQKALNFFRDVKRKYTLYMGADPDYSHAIMKNMFYAGWKTTQLTDYRYTLNELNDAIKGFFNGERTSTDKAVSLYTNYNPKSRNCRLFDASRFYIYKHPELTELSDIREVVDNFNKDIGCEEPESVAKSIYKRVNGFNKSGTGGSYWTEQDRVRASLKLVKERYNRLLEFQSLLEDGRSRIELMDYFGIKLRTYYQYKHDLKRLINIRGKIAKYSKEVKTYYPERLCTPVLKTIVDYNRKHPNTKFHMEEIDVRKCKPSFLRYKYVEYLDDNGIVDKPTAIKQQITTTYYPERLCTPDEVWTKITTSSNPGKLWNYFELRSSNPYQCFVDWKEVYKMCWKAKQGIMTRTDFDNALVNERGIWYKDSPCYIKPMKENTDYEEIE